ncbi:MAG: hypothetical protein R2708_16950 [Vicinamibacterales bacterium]
MTSFREIPSAGSTTLGMIARGHAHVLRDLGAEDAAGRQDDPALDHVFELADVPGPVVLHQEVQRLGRDLEHRPSVLFRVAAEEVVDQQGNVVLSLTQSREVNAPDHVEAIEEVLAEPSVLHFLLQVHVGGSDARRP